MNSVQKDKNNFNLTALFKPDVAFNSSKDSGETRKIYYISDIHLLHHLNKNEKNWKNHVYKIVKQLYTKNLIKDILNDEEPYIVFCGDISSSSEITKYFYHIFKMRYLFYLFKKWNEGNVKVQAVARKQALILYKKKTDEIKNKLKKLKYQLNKLGCDCDNETEIKKFYKNKSCPSYFSKKVKKYTSLNNEIEELKRQKENYILNLIKGKGYNYATYSFLNIFVVLGNHELNDFISIEEAVNFYKEFFNKEKIWFLHNSKLSSRKVNIFGGIGFAKFNTKYNANNLCSTNPPISREQEILESEKFLRDYYCALNESIKDNKVLMVISHYPVKDWLPSEEYSSICVYFNGHSHQNKIIHTNLVQVYSDNQIGYKKKNIKFKHVNLGVNYNPFIEYKDGYYEISIMQYEQFLLHKGASVQSTVLIDNQIKSGFSKFYMIKRSSFYGFFVVNQKTGTKICEGGRLKTISKIKHIEYFYNCFSQVVNKYLSAFAPYRRVQEQISNELKQMGFDGTIHGCIIDVDYFFHILLDPLDGKLTYYYSPFFGAVKTFNSFKQLVCDLKKNESFEFKTNLINGSSEFLLLQPTEIIEKNVENIMFVDRKNSIYALSAKINQIQRLFNYNILRVWNEVFAEDLLEDNSKYLVSNNLPRIKSEKK